MWNSSGAASKEGLLLRVGEESIVDGVKPGSIKALWAFNKSGYDLFDAALNEEHSSLSKNFTLPHKFTELFYNVTKLLVGKKYKF